MAKQKLSPEAQQALARKVQEEIKLYKQRRLDRIQTLSELAEPLGVSASTIKNCLHRHLTPRKIGDRNYEIKSSVKLRVRKPYRRIKGSREGKKVIVDRDKWDADHLNLVEKLISDEHFYEGEVWADVGKIYFSISDNRVDLKEEDGEVYFTATSGKSMEQLGKIINNYGLRIVHAKSRSPSLMPSLLVCQLNPNDEKYEYTRKVGGRNENKKS